MASLPAMSGRCGADDPGERGPTTTLDSRHAAVDPLMTWRTSLTPGCSLRVCGSCSFRLTPMAASGGRWMLPATRWAMGSPGPGCWWNSWVFLGHAVDTISIVSRDRQGWYSECLRTIASRLGSARYDVVFCFHSFWPFASEVRRIIDDARRSVPMVAYNHGSHWDPTDAFRQERYPALRLADLGNLLAVDAVLLVSDYRRATLLREVGDASAEAAAQLAARLWVVGLPIDTGLLDACRSEKQQSPTVVFNHFCRGRSAPCPTGSMPPGTQAAYQAASFTDGSPARDPFRRARKCQMVVPLTGAARNGPWDSLTFPGSRGG
jgi:hypothetical protein